VRRGLVLGVLVRAGVVLEGVVLEADVGEEGDLEVEVDVEEEEDVVVVEGGVVAVVDRDTIAFLVSYHNFLSLLVLTV
jgi:hypothetical protein